MLLYRIVGFLGSLLISLWLFVGKFVGGVQRPTVLAEFDFSPDGRWMVFNGVGRGGGDLFLWDLTTRKVRRLTDSEEEETHPRFSPDGKQIVYTAALPGNQGDYLFPHHIYIYNLQDGAISQVTSDMTRWDYSPSFSADGIHIVFEGATPELPASYPGDIYTVDIETRTCRRLTHENYNSMLRPHYWRNDSEILFTAYKHAEKALGSYLVSVFVSGSAEKPTLITPYKHMTSGGQPLGDDAILLVSDHEQDFDHKLYRFDCPTQQFTQIPQAGGVPICPIVSGTKFYWLAGLDGLFCLDTAEGENAVPTLLADFSLFERPTEWFDGTPLPQRRRGLFGHD